MASVSLMGTMLVGTAPNLNAASATKEAVIEPFAIRPTDTDLISIWRVTTFAYGQTVFMAGSSGYQVDNTASVNFTW